MALITAAGETMTVGGIAIGIGIAVGIAGPAVPTGIKAAIAQTAATITGAVADLAAII